MQNDEKQPSGRDLASARYARWVTGAGAGLAGGVGALALLAYAGGQHRGPLPFLPYAPAMRPNSALCLVLLASALLLLRFRPLDRRASRGAFVLAGLATLLALATLAQYVLGAPLGIDALLADVPRARMSPIAACALASMGTVLSLTALRVGATALCQGLLALTGLLSLLPVMGYLYRAPFLYSPGALTAVAPGTGVGLIGLACAGFALREEEGLWPLLAGDTAGSTLLRRALPLVVGLPVVFGLLRLEAERLGDVGHELGIALIAVTTVLTFAALLLWWSSWLRQQDLARRLATDKLREARDTLELRVEERTRALSNTEVELRRAAGELMLAKDAAERAMRTRTDFLARVSHEIRTPLNGLVGMLEIALRSELTPAQRGYVQTARSSATALLALLSDVLDFSKIDAGKLLLEAACFRLHDRAALALRDSAAAAHQKGLELYLQIDDDVPEFVVGDAQRLGQVLSNLVSNAVKFTQRGEVELRVSLRARNEDRVELCFGVCDTGVGIAPDKQREIFEAFAQADESTTRRYGGTGLGLTISSQLVGLMGGELRVESETDRGARFWFTLELGAQAEGAPEQDIAAVRTAGKRALLVEPDPRHRSALRGLLQGWGVETTEAAAPEVQSVLRAAELGQVPFTFLLLDELAAASLGTSLAALRESAGPDLSIVLMTLATPLDGAREARLAHCSAHLTKPPVAAELLETLTNLAASPRKASRPQPEAPLDVLVVEDNEVNRRVACFLLQSAGHRVVAVEDGRRALAVLDERSFDVVLMDGHMPQLDGVATTREIRARERASGRHTPIIALTAQALKGDRERYLAAGMDAYLSKPFQSAQLLGTIREVVERLDPPRSHSGSPPPSDLLPRIVPAAVGPLRSDAQYDREDLLARLRGAELLLPQLVRVFAEDVPLLLDALGRAVVARDTTRVQQSAHKLVGALLTVGGNRAGALARGLENDARSGSLDDADTRMSRLNAEVQALLEAMERTGDLVRAPAAIG